MNNDKQLNWKHELQQFLAEVEGVLWSQAGVLARLETLDEGHYLVGGHVMQVSHTVH